ncbi:RE1 [Symbiodinium natans]|uniref:RE1 protein n=1 Tax=Symbiodinium natans TaxID=878477 RepID=A0A812PQT6_9DINO|nr:RE1 [Symbiodinium natans]
MGMLAQELNVRTESLSKAVTAVADLSSMVRDGAMVLEGQVKDASDERQCLVAQMNRVWKNQEDFSARLLALEGAASRLEESSMQQQAALQELDLKLGGLNLAFDQAREAVQQLQDEDPASLESAVGTMRSQTALLSTTMTRLEALSHDVELANRRVAQQEAASKKDLEQLASVTDATVKLEARCEQIERALEERGQLMAPVPERTVRFQQTSKPPEVAKPTTSWQPLPGTEGTQVQRFEMSPQSLQQPAIDEWYTAEEEGEGPASWDFSWKPPGLFQPQSLGRDMLLKRCPLDSGRAIAAVVASSFGAFFRRRMKEALDRYQQRQSSGVEEDVPSIPPEEREYETRLGVMLIKVLPASIRQPVMERTTSLEEPLSTLLLLESVIERFSPGGTSEMTSLLQYQRCLPTANSYKELLEILRKFDLARTRTTYLQLPGLPAHEVIKSLDGLTRTLERKNPALAMRLNLIRMTPEVMVPSETGVQRMLTTLVQEGRRLQAEDEISKSKSNQVYIEDSQASQAAGRHAGKGKGRSPKDTVCKFHMMERGCMKGEADRSEVLSYITDQSIALTSDETFSARSRSEQGIEDENESDVHPLAGVDQEGRENITPVRHPLWYLVMSPEEFLQWQHNSSWICTRACDQFRRVNSPTAIAIGIWFTLAWEGYPEAISDVEVGEEQIILQARRVLVMHEDGVARQGYVVWVMDTDSGQEQFLALSEWETEEAPRFFPEAKRVFQWATSEQTTPSGETVNGFRTKDGEVVLNASGSEWILGVVRIIEIGGKFSWSSQEAVIEYPYMGQTQKVRCSVLNGLPYLGWSQFSQIRKVLSKHWQDNGFRMKAAAVAAGERENLHIKLEDLVEWTSLEAEAHEVRCEEKGYESLLLKDKLTREDIQQAFDLAALTSTRTSTRTQRAKVMCDGTEGSKVRAWIFGGYAHGGMSGVTKVTKQHPTLAKLLARYFRQEMPDARFGSIAVLDSVALEPHRDNNSKDYLTYITTFTDYDGGELWVQDESGEDFRLIKSDEDPVRGTKISIKEGVYAFDGRRWHGTEPFDGRRLVAAAYTPRNYKCWTEELRMELSELGFPIAETGDLERSQTLEGKSLVAVASKTLAQEDVSRKMIAAFQATAVPFGECLLDSKGWNTLEERRALHTHSFQSPTTACNQGPVLTGSNLTHISSAAEVIDVDDDGDVEGLGESEAVDKSHTEILEPWDLEKYTPATEEDAALCDLWKHCREGLYCKTDEACLRGRGHRRPHRKIAAQDIQDGVISLDLSGPHRKSYAGNKYAVVACVHLKGPQNLSFVRPVPNKEAKTVADAVRDILYQLLSMTGGEQVTFRIHSDQGKEFVAKLTQDALKPFNHFRTFSVPYSHASNGRVEATIDALKSSTATFLLGGGLDVQFWDMVMVHSAKLQRMRALNIPIPKDLPVPGDYVLCRLPADLLPDLTDRTERGIFMGLTEHTANGSKVLVERGGRLVIREVRLPILLNRVSERWRVATHPRSEESIWVSTRGKVAWDAPPASEVLTLEERRGVDVRDPESIPERLAELLDKKRDAESVREIFNLFSHGVLHKGPDAAVASMVNNPTADEHPEKHVAVEDQQADAPDYPTSSKKNRYTVMSYGEEQLANRVEQELIEASIAPAQAEVVGLEGFYGENREAWKMSLEKEDAKMDGALEEALPEELRSKLGLPPDAPLPKPIPSKVVCTLKPNIDGSSEKLEKSRLCACGNFEQGVDDNGEPWSSPNIPPEIVRCFTSLAASNVTWTLGSLDVEAAFLNAEITSGDPVIIMPPKVMKDLGMVRPRTLWIARRLIYGLRRGPTEWERERDHKVDHAKLEAKDGDRHGALHLKPLSLAAGLWKVTNSKGETLGAFCCYVDDGLVVGDAEIIRRVMAFVKSLWAVKGQGVLNKEGAGVEQGIQVDEDMVLLPKTELRFLGVEIEVDGANLALHQHKYMACELRKRGWLDLKGSDCLPTPKEGLLAPPLRDETFEQTKLRAQKEVGTLMWISLRSRPDVAACLGIAATLVATHPEESVRLTRGIWRFLRATWDVRLMFRAKHEETPSQVVRMTADASFAPGGARSRTGYAIFMGDHLISWRSQRQALVAWSATEAELEATATVVQDGAKFQETLSELVGHKLELLLQNDNSGGLTLLTRQRFFTQDMRTRHFAVRCAYVRDQIAVLNIVLEHKGTDTLEADALTKVLSKEKLRQGRLGLRLLKK